MRYRFVATFLLALLGLGPVRASVAAPVEGLFEATVSGDSTESSRGMVSADALRQVVVRVTGRAGAGTDPALASLYADAPRFVQTFRSMAAGQVTVSFDATLVETALTKASQRLWGRDRPQIMVVLDGPASAQAATRRDLMQAGQLRGLPLNFAESKSEPPPELREGKPEALRSAAKTFGADGLLLVRIGAASVSAVWSGPAGEGTATGTVTEIFDAMADRLGSALAVSGADSARLTVVIQGVADLKSFAGALSQLASLPSVRGLSIETVSATALKIRITGSDAVTLRKAARDGGHFDVHDDGVSPRQIDLVYRP